MALNLKFTKFDNTPWGFRLAGGSDFPQPLTVIRVNEESLAECMGMKVGDVVVRLNDEPVSGMTHGQAHEALMRAGNNFVLAVQREEDPVKAVEGLTDENIVPYKIPLADLPPVFPESILTEATASDHREEETTGETAPCDAEKLAPEAEELPDKPKDANSEIVPNQNLTDDEIAQLILEEEELLNDQGVLGVNFKKLRPRVPVLKESKVVEELQYIATEPPPRVQELKRTSTFLQKPQRPVPEPRKKDEEVNQHQPAETYRVVIKKQQRRSVTDRLLERGLLRPGEPSPEPPTPEVKMASPETEARIDEETFSISEIPDEPVEAIPITPELELSLDCKIPSRGSVDLLNEDDSHATRKLSRRKEISPASSRRAPNKRNSRAFYTRGHYFRRCIFGNHTDAKRSSKVRSRKDRPDEINANCVLSDSCPTGLQDRRASVEGFSRVKGHYLETYLNRRESWPRRVIEPLFQQTGDFPPDVIPEYALRARRSSAWKTRYAESVMMRAFKFVIAVSGLEPLLGRSLAKSQIRRRRFHMRGRYLERAIAKDFAGLSNRVREILLAADAQAKAKRKYCGMIKMRGHYVERCLERQSLRVADYIANYLGVPSRTQELRRAACANRSVPKTPKRKFSTRAHYGERILGQYIQSFSNAAEYVCSSILPSLVDSSELSHAAPMSSPRKDLVRIEEPTDNEQGLLDYVSAEVFHRGSRRMSGLCGPRKSITESEKGAIGEILESSGDFLASEVFHRGSRRMSGLLGPRKSITDNEKGVIGEILQSSGDYVATEVFHRGSRRMSGILGPRKSITDNEKGVIGELLQSSGDYVATEVFHRGSRRMSGILGPRKSITENEKGVIGEMLQSSGDFVSSEVFHRGSRRMSGLLGPRKSITESEKSLVGDILQSSGDFVSSEVFHRGSRRMSGLLGPRKSIAETEKSVIGDILQSSGDFVSSEVFHRGSRRMSGLLSPRKSIAETEKSVIGDILQSSGDFVSSEVFHRRSRRMSGLMAPRKSIAETEKSVIGDILQSSGDFVSSEVFHRRSRRMSGLLSPRKSIAETEKSIIGDILQSSGDFVSSEVFHRRSRRMSHLLGPRKSITEEPSWLDILRKSYLNCFSRQVADDSKVLGACGEKELREIERDGRRLSFVPTVLYEGLTNRIGVDFTRFVAYAFVPCTSVILLYMYK